MKPSLNEELETLIANAQADRLMRVLIASQTIIKLLRQTRALLENIESDNWEVDLPKQTHIAKLTMNINDLLGEEIPF